MNSYWSFHNDDSCISVSDGHQLKELRMLLPSFLSFKKKKKKKIWLIKYDLSDLFTLVF